MRTSDYYYGRAIIAALVATCAVSVLYLLKNNFAVMPQVDPLMLMANAFGAADIGTGWATHFIGGSLIGGAFFAWLAPHFFGPLWARGMQFGVLSWLVMMLVTLPMANAGFFGLAYGQTFNDTTIIPATLLVLQLVYGFILGSTYSQLLVQKDSSIHHTHLQPEGSRRDGYQQTAASLSETNARLQAERAAAQQNPRDPRLQGNG